eukprot:g8312.t1
MSPPRTSSTSRTSNTRPLVLAFLSSALLATLSYVPPASAFLSPTSSSLSSSFRATTHAERVSPLFGIKRKVKAEMETNFSGKVVEPASAETSMFGSDANALFDLIEKNKKKAAETAAAAALTADDEDEGEEGGEGAEGGGAGDAQERKEAA